MGSPCSSAQLQGRPAATRPPSLCPVPSPLSGQTRRRKRCVIGADPGSPPSWSSVRMEDGGVTTGTTRLCWGGHQEGPPYHTGDQETASRECKHHPGAPGMGARAGLNVEIRSWLCTRGPAGVCWGDRTPGSPLIAARCPGHGVPCPLDTPTAGSPETHGDMESFSPAVDPRDCTKIRPPALSPSPTPGSGGPSGALLPSTRSLYKIQPKTCC